MLTVPLCEFIGYCLHTVSLIDSNHVHEHPTFKINLEVEDLLFEGLCSLRGALGDFMELREGLRLEIRLEGLFGCVFRRGCYVCW